MNCATKTFKFDFGQKSTTSQKKQKLIQKLAPTSIQNNLIRIGCHHDGGYLISNDLENIIACFSPGVGDQSSFEDTLAKEFGIKSFLADYTLSV